MNKSEHKQEHKSEHKPCYNRLKKPIILIVILVGIYQLILIYLNIKKENDPLITMRSSYLGNYINGWALTHLIFNIYLGYYYPDCFMESFILGIIWEMYEYLFGAGFPLLFPKMAREMNPMWYSWYYGSYEDIVVNTVGFIIGKKLKKMIN